MKHCWCHRSVLTAQKLTLSMRVYGPHNSVNAFWHTFFCRQTDIHIDIYTSHKILIVQPSMGLASLAQLFAILPHPLLHSPINPSLLQHITTESSREFVSSEEYHSALRKLNNRKRQVVMFFLLFFFPFVSFSLLSFSSFSLVPFSIL